MDMTGEHRISAPRDVVWQALNGDVVLRDCILGCTELEKKSDPELSAIIAQKIGPVKAKVAGDVERTNINAPESHSIRGEGSGGVAGFAKGGADVTLSGDGSARILRYTEHATVGGKLARLGSRLIDATVRKLAARFFVNFQAHLNTARPSAAE